MPDPALLVALSALYALLNLSLATLVLRVRPLPRANLVLGILFIGNGIAVQGALVLLGVDERTAGMLAAFVGPITHGALLLLPFLVPRRRLSRAQENGLLIAAVLFVAAEATVNLLSGWGILPHWVSWYSAYATVYVVLALGTLMLLDAYMGPRLEVERTRATWFLAGYVMTAASFALGAQPYALGAAAVSEGLRVVTYALWVVPLATVAAVGVALLLRWARGRGQRGDLVVAAAAGLGLALALADTSPGWVHSLSYLVLRPVVFAYAMLRFQIVEVDPRGGATAVAAGASALGAVFLAAALALDSLGLPTLASGGLALTATSCLAAVAAAPTLRLLAPKGDDHEARRKAVYAAALVDVLGARTGHGTSGDELLAKLRDRLHLSDHEHQALAAAVREALGEPVPEPAAGVLYLGRYRVERLLGEGGFGRAFLAHDEQVDRPVVLKIAPSRDETEARRALREARLLADARDPHIVTIYDVEVVGGRVVLVLEYMEGGSLADRLREGPLPLGDAVEVADAVLAALGTAHARGIVHRDVKPGNVLQSRDGRWRLADFGVAKPAPDAETASGLTLPGRHPGSLRYMSPEQARGLPLDGRSDLYSVGALLYEALTGRPYLDFTGRDVVETHVAIAEEAPALPIVGLPDGVNALLADALAKDRAARPPDALAMRSRLGPFLG